MRIEVSKAAGYSDRQSFGRGPSDTSYPSHAECDQGLDVAEKSRGHFETHTLQDPRVHKRFTWASLRRRPEPAPRFCQLHDRLSSSSRGQLVPLGTCPWEYDGVPDRPPLLQLLLPKTTATFFELTMLPSVILAYTQFCRQIYR